VVHVIRQPGLAAVVHVVVAVGIANRAAAVDAHPGGAGDDHVGRHYARAAAGAAVLARDGEIDLAPIAVHLVAVAESLLARLGRARARFASGHRLRELGAGVAAGAAIVGVIGRVSLAAIDRVAIAVAEAGVARAERAGAADAGRHGIGHHAG